MIHIRYHDVLLWNEIIADWLDVDTWFGTLNSPGARMRARGLVCPLFVVQTTWFRIPNAFDAKGEWVEHGIKDHEVCDGNSV